MNFSDLLRHVPDFPKAGIDFIDVTTLLKEGAAFKLAVDAMANRLSEKNPDVIVGMEARGFIFGAAVAYALGVGFVPARKKGKLPYRTIESVYALEYGEDSLQMHADGILPGQRVAIVDDLLATGGTAKSAVGLVRQLGGDVVSLTFLVELTALGAGEKFSEFDLFSLVKI